MKTPKLFCYLLPALVILAGGCKKESIPTDAAITISGSVGPFTKAGEAGFQTNDSIGVYIVNAPGNLVNFGNRADNVSFKYNGSSWEPLGNRKFTWPENADPKVDVYGYFPYIGVIATVQTAPFSVQADQSATQSGATMSNYEASDFLWGKTAGTAPTTTRIPIQMRHLLSKINITITAGTGVGTINASQLKVFVNGVKLKSTINLRDGSVSPAATDNAASSLVPIKSTEAGLVYKAIVVPQTAASDFTVEARIGSDIYTYTPDAAPTFTTGKQHNFNITLRKTSGKLNVDGKTVSGQWTEN